MELQAGEQVVFEGHPSWRGVLSFYVKNTLADIVAGVVVGLFWGTWWGVLVFGVLMAVTIIVGLVMRMSTVYTITNERLRIRRGILSKSVQQTNINRVQNVITNQSPVERLLRVGRVDFETAGESESNFTFAGIADPDSIVAVINEAKREAATPQGI